MATPTIIATFSTAFDTTTTPKSVPISCSVGDTLLVIAQGELGASSPNIVSIAGYNFTTIGGVGGNPSYPLCYSLILQNIPVALSNQTLTVSAGSGSKVWGFTCMVIRDCYGYTGMGNSNSASSGTMSATGRARYPSSLGLFFSTDGGAGDGTTRSWKTINGLTPSVGNGLEAMYNLVPSKFTAYIAGYTNLGVENVFVTPGLATPSSSGANVCNLVEIIGQEAVFPPNNQYSYSGLIGTSISAGFTVRPASTRTLLLTFVTVGVTAANGTDADVTTTVTYDGIPMNSIAKIHSNNGTQGYIEAFYLLNPTQSSSGKTLSVTASRSVELSAYTYSFTNVDQSNPFSFQTNSGASTNPSTTFTNTNSRSVIVGAMVSGLSISSINYGSPSGVSSDSQINNFYTDSDGGCIAVGNIITPKATQKIGWNITSSSWALIALRINPSSYFPQGVMFNWKA